MSHQAATSREKKLTTANARQPISTEVAFLAKFNFAAALILTSSSGRSLGFIFGRGGVGPDKLKGVGGRSVGCSGYAGGLEVLGHLLQEAVGAAIAP